MENQGGDKPVPCYEWERPVHGTGVNWEWRVGISQLEHLSVRIMGLCT